MRIAVENAGAERGLLILIRGGEPRIEAEATTGRGRVEVAVRQEAVAPSDLPQSALHYVIRTRSACCWMMLRPTACIRRTNMCGRSAPGRSCACQSSSKRSLSAHFIWRTTSTPCVFTPDRVTVLQLLASQAAISLENAALYADLQLQVGLLQRLPVSAWTLKPDGTPDFVNQVWLEFSGQTLDFVRSHPEAWMTAVHPEDRETVLRAFWDGVHSGQGFCVRSPVLARSGRELSLASPASRRLARCRRKSPQIRRYHHRHRRPEARPKKRYGSRREIWHASTA